MIEEDISQEYKLKNIKEINNYFIKEIDQNELLSNKNNKVCTILNYIEHFLTLIFAVICISISVFTSLIDISKGIVSSSIGLNVCAIVSKIKKYKSIIKKKKKKHDEITLLAKTNLNCIKDLPRSLADSYIVWNCFNLIDMLRKYDYMKEEINYSKM